MRLVAVGFPAGDAESRGLGACEIPRVFIQSTDDQFGPRDVMESYFASLEGPKELIWMQARDHFFAGGLDEFEGRRVFRAGRAVPTRCLSSHGTFISNEAEKRTG